MSELTYLIIRFGFLLLLWLFVFGTIYALRSDLFGAPVRRMKRKDQAANQLDAAPAHPDLVPAAATTPAGAFAAETPQPGAASSEPKPVPLRSVKADPDLDLPSAGATGPAKRLVITSGVAAGTEISLDESLVTIGRSSDSTLVIVDEYTSTHHATLERLSTGWRLTDLDSTNGTTVDGHKLVGATDLAPFVPVTIGATSFELRP